MAAAGSRCPWTAQTSGNGKQRARPGHARGGRGIQGEHETFLFFDGRFCFLSPYDELVCVCLFVVLSFDDMEPFFSLFLPSGAQRKSLCCVDCHLYWLPGYWSQGMYGLGWTMNYTI